MSEPLPKHAWLTDKELQGTIEEAEEGDWQ